MKERPILFSSPMIRAILEGRKVQTRRIMKPHPEQLQHHEHGGRVVYDGEHRMWCWKSLVLENIWDFPDGDDRKALAAHSPHGVPGDRLWVRETWGDLTADHPRCKDGRKPVPGDRIAYRANPSDDAQWVPGHPGCADFSWRPSIFMPRWASRITLEIVQVRVQRLQDISEEDAKAEGAPMGYDGPYSFHQGFNHRGGFMQLWGSINGEDSWATNPWVWCISFAKVQAVKSTAKEPSRKSLDRCGRLDGART